MALLARAGDEPVVADAPAPKRARRPPEVDFRHVPVIAVAGVALAVLAFSSAWVHGRMTLDGVGAVMLVREALGHWFVNGHVPYWLSEMWTGTPLFSLAPSLPTLELVPLASVVGPEAAVRIAIVLAQIVGGWGAFVLAASLWGRRTPAAAVAGFVYALHPLFITHGALFGHEPAVWVMAATPWLAWSFRRALREKASGYVAVAGAAGGFAVLHQAEHAYALILMCACMLAVELARARPSQGGEGAKAVLGRAAAAAGIGLGLCAFWLLPFLTMSKSFVLTPPAAARAELTSGSGAVLGRHPEVWVTRSPGLKGTASFEDLLRTFGPRGGLSKGVFYLSWVCLLLTIVTIVAAPRRDDDGHLTAIVFSSALGVWLSSGGVSLATSQLVTDRRVVPLIVLGIVAALLVYAFVSRLRIGRRGVAALATIAFLILMPYLAPLITLQRVVPFLSNIRFPRFYPLAALGLALGTAYPLLLAQRWVTKRNVALAPLFTATLSLVVLGAFLVDIAPYRSFYSVTPPDSGAAYARVAETLDNVGGEFRVANAYFGDPRSASELLKHGEVLSVGWPHPMASKRVWRLTAEAMVAPETYRNLALALSGTAYLTTDTLNPAGTAVDRVQIIRNPYVMPLVRAYDSVVVVEDDEVAPELAVALAPKNVSVIVGGAREAADLTGLSRGVVRRNACDAAGPGAAPDLVRELAMACAGHEWIGVYDGRTTVSIGASGAVINPLVDGLKGVGVWLDRPAGASVLSLMPVAADGTLGPALAQSTGFGGGSDLATFLFDPIPDSGGKRYAALLSCGACPSGEEPRILVADAQRGPGNLLDAGALDRGKVANFSLVYDGMPGSPPSGTRLGAVTYDSGTWRVQTSGTHPSVVVVATAWFPGWQARVDGHKARVLIADGAFLGVAVPAGEHQVTLVYKKPVAAAVGLVVTAGTLLGVLLFLPSRRRGRRRMGRRTRPGAPGPRRSSWEEVGDPETV